MCALFYITFRHRLPTSSFATGSDRRPRAWCPPPRPRGIAYLLVSACDESCRFVCGQSFLPDARDPRRQSQAPTGAVPDCRWETIHGLKRHMVGEGAYWLLVSSA